MCARRPTSAMPKPFLCCERAFCRSMVVMCRGGDVTCFDVMRLLAGWDEVMWLVVRWHGMVMWLRLVATCHVMSCDVTFCVVSCDVMQCYVRWCALMWWAVICCALQWDGNVMSLWRDSLWGDVVLYSTLFYSTPLYPTLPYPILLYSTLLWSTRLYSTILYSTLVDFTKYCACQEKSLSWLILLTFETSFTMRGATRVTLQLHQILRLLRKITFMIDPLHPWNVIYNEQSN